jgi:hypothetical protein
MDELNIETSELISAVVRILELAKSVDGEHVPSL